MAKRRAPQLDPGVVEVSERRRYTRTAGDDGQQLPLDGWLLTVGSRQDVTHVSIYKQQRDSRGQLKYQLLPDRMDAPCDMDPGEIFRKWGDGDYRFSAVKADHSFHTHKLESVIGYGAGAQNGAGPVAGSAQDPLESSLREMNNFMRQSIVSAQLRAMYRDLVNAPAAAAPGTGDAPSPAEEEALHTATFDRLLNQMTKMQSLTVAAAGKSTSVTDQLVGKVLERAFTQEPVDRTVDTVSKLLEFTDRLSARVDPGGPRADLDLTQLVVVTLLGLVAQSPELKTLLAQLIGKIAPSALARIAGATATRTAETTPSPTAASDAAPVPVDGSAPGPAHESPQATVLRTIVYPVIRRAIELKDTDLETYERIVENHLPGFLDQWAQMPLEDSLSYLQTLDPSFLATLEAREWLSAFYRFVKESQEPPAS